MKNKNINNFKKKIDSKISFTFEFRFRLLLLGLIIFIILTLVAVRLYFLQKQSNEHSKRIVRQSVRRIRIPAHRGKIFTNDLKLLAENVARVDMVFYPEEMRKSRINKTVDLIYDNIQRIGNAIGRNSSFTKKKILETIRRSPGLPIKIFTRLNSTELALGLEAARGIDGVDFLEDNFRYYPSGKMAAHLVGYARMEDPKVAHDKNSFFYYISDLKGVCGLEKAFDKIPEKFPLAYSVNSKKDKNVLGLRGVPGYSVIQVDNLGFIRNKQLEYMPPEHGNNLVLTINSKAQKIVENLLQDKVGAFVVLNADTGDVVACASSPVMDLSFYSPILTQKYYSSLLSNKDRPLLDRALRQIYAPGSILKPLVAMSFLNSGISPNKVVHCDGFTQIGDAKVRCSSWRSGGHGGVNMVQALARSCNDYMIENSFKVRLSDIAKVLSSAGIGEKSNILLPEVYGIFPSNNLKKRIHKTSWTRYDTGLLSMGQGIIGVSPLQAALFCGAIANGGKLLKPNLVYSIVDSAGKVVLNRKVEVRKHLAVSKENLQIIRSGMYEVVNSYRGSGRKGKVENFKIYGKTGSAQVGFKPNIKLVTWFIFFTTVEDKTYAGAIMLEGGTSGGGSCAPLAADFIREYFN